MVVGKDWMIGIDVGIDYVDVWCGVVIGGVCRLCDYLVCGIVDVVIGWFLFRVIEMVEICVVFGFVGVDGGVGFGYCYMVWFV